MKKKKRIFASAPSEQAQQTKKEVLSGKCLRTQHDKADRQTKLFKAADGIIAALKKRSALPVHANNPRAAFTLAEVLIALTIIGVVSALTIPTLVQKTNKQEYVSALQKAYSTLSQATNMIIAEEGSPRADQGGWADNSAHINELFRKHISNIKECKSGSGCFASGYYKTLAGGNWNITDSLNDNHPGFMMADGMAVKQNDENSPDCTYVGEGLEGSCKIFFVDVNGHKKPNQMGRDLFVFILKENGLFPAGCSAENIENVCSKNNAGYSCACKVLREGKMDY